MKITARGVKFQPTIRDMCMLGVSVAYTVPWAYNPSSNALDLDYSVTLEPMGTSSMKVTKTVDGYELDIPEDYQYSRVTIIHI